MSLVIAGILPYLPLFHHSWCVLCVYLYMYTVPYSWKIWRGIKFGDLAIYYNCQIKICQNFLLTYICMAIPYWIAKFKSASITILGSTTKFNSCQCFRLYSMINLSVISYSAPLLTEPHAVASPIGPFPPNYCTCISIVSNFCSFNHHRITNRHGAAAYSPWWLYPSELPEEWTSWSICWRQCISGVWWG